MKKKRNSVPMISCFVILFISLFFNLIAEESTSEISNWEARLELARVLSYLKKYDESLKEYRKLLEIEPNSSIARVEMAKVLFYQDKADEALSEFAKIPPEALDESSWVIVADIYRKKKNYDEAEKIYANYLDKFPEDDKVRLKLAELLSWQKRYDDSLYHYRIMLDRNPEDIQLRRRYAQVLTWAGEDEEAIREWKKTLK